MKLNLVKPQAGWAWMQDALRCFGRRPLPFLALAMSFIMLMSLLSEIGLVGALIKWLLAPSLSLGLMAGAHVVQQNRVPLPSVLLSAFVKGWPHTRQMLGLGLGYGVGMALLLGIVSLFDQGAAASALLQLTPPTNATTIASFAFQLQLGAALYMPMAMMFWHAPALVHWQQVPPLKAMFFSFLACWRNKGAMLAFAMALLMLMIASGAVVGLLGGLGRIVLIPIFAFAVMLTSIGNYISYRNSFSIPPIPPT
jgi:hypothetical protein